MLEPRIETVFCDDIREEVGNKRSLMGIYHSEMFVHDFPTVLPRLCFYVTFTTDIESTDGKVEFKVVKGKDEEELISTNIDIPIDKMNENNLGVPYTQRNLILAFGLSPFSVDAETVIRVIAQTEQVKLMGPCLRIRKAISATSSEMSPSS